MMHRFDRFDFELTAPAPDLAKKNKKDATLVARAAHDNGVGSMAYSYMVWLNLRVSIEQRIEDYDFE